MTSSSKRSKPEVSVYIALSLDGYIARTDGSIDWLRGNTEPEPGEDYGFRAFFDRVDALVMGRNTFDKVLDFESWAYGEKPVFVLTHRPVDLPGELSDRVTLLQGDPGKIVTQLADRGLKHLYVDGGETICQFLDAGLVDTLTLTRIPVVLGEGIPLFGKLDRELRFKHLRTDTFPDDLVQSTYRLLEA